MDAEGLPYIECSSCHDPHSANKTFLRAEDNSGGLCMTCHAK
jgi:predicted CXXCH cytochrome family protein